ncbi:hypothetical protein D6C80_07354 [Aureobasidium pullulans]|nr:hypothetical protein D6C80_07354 [Aureobasidium pullulans]
MRISTIRQRKDGFLRRRSKPSAVPMRPNAAPSIKPNFSETSEHDTMTVDCKAGLAQISIINGLISRTLSYDCSLSGQRTNSVIFDLADFDQTVPLHVDVLGCNGRIARSQNAWGTKRRDVIRIDNSDIILRKQSAIGVSALSKVDYEDTDAEVEGHQWTVLLNEKGPNGKLSRANTIDLRVGCVLDGAVVYYEDGHKTPCGLRYTETGSTHYFGGHQSQKLHLPKDVDIVKVEVNRSGYGCKVLSGIVMTLSNGIRKGALNDSEFTGSIPVSNKLQVLEPGVGEKIVGFYGTSSHYTEEFGIITGPKDEDLPPQTYDMPQLQNIQERGSFARRV